MNFFMVVKVLFSSHSNTRNVGSNSTVARRILYFPVPSTCVTVCANSNNRGRQFVLQ